MGLCGEEAGITMLLKSRNPPKSALKASAKRTIAYPKFQSPLSRNLERSYCWNSPFSIAQKEEKFPNLPF